MRRRRKEKRRNIKNKEVHQKQSSKTKRRCFFKRRRNGKYVVQEFYTKGRCETQFEFFKTFSRIKAFFFQKRTKKKSQKKVGLFKTKVFFAQKSGKDKKKAGVAKVDKKLKKHRNHKEGQTEQDKMCPPKKVNKENKLKIVEKGCETKRR